MEIRAVLFDLDNTLFDHVASARAGLTVFVQRLGVPANDEMLDAWFHIEQSNFDRFLSGELTFAEQRRERLRQFLPLIGLPHHEDDLTLDELFTGYLRAYEDAWTAFPDAAPLLRCLQHAGVPAGVITNGNHEQQRKKIKRIGLESLLDCLFSSDQMGYAKPDAAAFTLPCEHLQLAPRHVLYVGDSFAVDVMGARDAGLQSMHLDRPAPQQEGVLQSLADLMPILKLQGQTLQPGGWKV